MFQRSLSFSVRLRPDCSLATVPLDSSRRSTTAARKAGVSCGCPRV